MKKNYSLLISTLVAIVILSGCYDTETIESERGKPFEVVRDSDDPLDHYIYEFYKKYNTIIKYDYEILEWKWDWNELRDWTVIYQTDRDVLLDAAKTFEQKFVNTYPDKFMKDFLPHTVFLAKTLTDNFNYDYNIEVACAYKHLTLGCIKDDFDTWDDTKKTQWAAKIHQKYWSQWMVRLGYLVVPESFYEVSASYYNKNWGKGYDEPTDMCEMGFWTDRFGNINPSSKWVWPPEQIDDWKQFVSVIMAHNKQQLDEKMKGYPLLKTKADIVIKYFKDNYDLDIQTLSE